MPRLQINQYTEVKYSKDFVHEKLHEKYLASDRLNKSDKEVANAVVKTLVSGVAATDFVNRHIYERKLSGKPTDWAFEILDPRHGRVGLLKFRGIGAALFFKRDIVEITRGVGEKLPEHPLTDPDDAWVRVDLFGPSAKRANIVLKNYHEELQAENKLLKEQLNIMKQKFDKTETKLNRYVMLEEKKKQLAAEKLAAEKEKERAKKLKYRQKQDRLCTLCGCYENYHEFDKKGNCKGCLGGKPKCKDCTFRPKRKRVKKELIPPLMKSKPKEKKNNGRKRSTTHGKSRR